MNRYPETITQAGGEQEQSVGTGRQLRAAISRTRFIHKQRQWPIISSWQRGTDGYISCSNERKIQGPQKDPRACKPHTIGSAGE